MTAEDLLNYLMFIVFVAIFVVVLTNAVRRPRRATINVALLFGALAAVFTYARVTEWLEVEPPEVIGNLAAALLLAAPLLLLRLADDFAGVRAFILRLAEGGLVGGVAVVLLFSSPYNPLQVLVLVGYFVVVQVYATWRFVLGARAGGGPSRARMRAVAWGSGLFALALVFAGIRAALEDAADFWGGLISVTATGAGIAYFVAFAPPRFLRGAWRTEQLERFLALTATTARHRGLVELVQTIEQGVAATLGAPRAAVLLWNAGTGALEWPNRPAPEPSSVDRSTTPAFRVFESQQPLFVEDAERSDPHNAEGYLAFGARSILLAPISLEDRRFGVLSAFGERPPLFAEDDLALVAALAQHAAVLIENHQLLSEMADVRAREEATRMKDEFLSAAAHDLKTPLTTLVAQSQLMQRRVLAQPERPADPIGIQRMVVEAQRMRRLVDDLLDASRTEQDGFVGTRTPTDLAALAREVSLSVEAPRHTIEVGGEAVEATVDRNRIAQVLSNLLDNAIKYSPAGGVVSVEVSTIDTTACVVVRDQGIGIPEADRAVIFERFQRGSQMVDPGMPGLGLGLYLCRRIVEEHGGRISVSATEQGGSAFRVELPLHADADLVKGSESLQAKEQGGAA